MARKKSAPPELTPNGRIPAPFTVAVDSNEKGHGTDYKFEGIRANADQNNAIFEVSKVYRVLHEGDYAVDGLPGFVVERKTKKDLFASIGKRENFRERMEILQSHYRSSIIMIESEPSEIDKNPPSFPCPKTGLSRIYPSVLMVNRTIQSWLLDYPNVHWFFAENRRKAEVWTFRFLQAHWKKNGIR